MSLRCAWSTYVYMYFDVCEWQCLGCCFRMYLLCQPVAYSQDICSDGSEGVLHIYVCSSFENVSARGAGVGAF